MYKLYLILNLFILAILPDKSGYKARIMSDYLKEIRK